MRCITIDISPNFYAWTGVVSGETLLVLSPQVETNDTARRAALALMQRRGVDHSTDTHNCPLSRAN